MEFSFYVIVAGNVWEDGVSKLKAKVVSSSGSKSRHDNCCRQVIGITTGKVPSTENFKVLIRMDICRVRFPKSSPHILQLFYHC